MTFCTLIYIYIYIYMLQSNAAPVTLNNDRYDVHCRPRMRFH